MIQKAEFWLTYLILRDMSDPFISITIDINSYQQQQQQQQQQTRKMGYKVEKNISLISNQFHANQLKFSQHSPISDEAYWGP